jgi:hypothetical protein
VCISSTKSRISPAGDPNQHEIVFFLKPELLQNEDSAKTQAIVDFLVEKLSAYEMQLGSLSVLTADYLHKHGIMQAHYGVINRISREGQAALTDEAQAKLKEEFAGDLELGAPVMGGHQILERFSDLTPEGLSAIWNQKPYTKLAGGSYAADVEIQGQRVIALNGFHPLQIEHFTAPGKRIAVATLRTRRSWESLRQALTGATDPHKAAAGSIRAELLARKDEFGLPHVDQGFNGIHLSAGPLEGLVELVRFAGDRSTGLGIRLNDTCFARLLSRAGLTESQIALLLDNPTLHVPGDEGVQAVSAFDLTEEMDAPDAVQALTERL